VDKSKIETTQSDNNPRILKGIKNKGILPIKCNDCNRHILQLQLVDAPEGADAEVITRVLVKCELCNGHSDVVQILGTFYPGSPSDDLCFDVVEPEDSDPETDVGFRVWAKKKS